MRKLDTLQMKHLKKATNVRTIDKANNFITNFASLRIRKKKRNTIAVRYVALWTEIKKSNNIIPTLF